MARCKHGNAVCSRCIVITDAAKRISDQINGRITFTQPDDLFHNPYMAFALEDGHTDGVRYPTKAETVRHQSNEYRYCYFSFRTAMAGVSPKDAQIFLDMHRHIYEQGGRLIDPEDYIMPQARGQGAWPL